MTKYPESAKQMLDAVLASIGEAVLIVDPEGRFIRNCNRAAEQLFGYSRDELINQSTEILHIDHEHFKRFGEISETVLDRGEVFRGEYRMKRKDGSIFETSHTVSPIEEELGWKAGVVSIIRDISNYKVTERKLKSEKERLEEAQRIGQLGDWYYDVRTEQITWKPMMFEIFERDPELGSPTYEELQSYYPEDFDFHEQMVQRAIHEKTPYSFDIKISTENGNTKYVHVEGKPEQGDHGNVIKLYGTVQDITERKKAFRREKQLKQIFYRALDMAPLPILMRKEDGQIVFINEAYRRGSGYDRKEFQTVDEWVRKALPDFTEEQLRERVSRVFSSQELVEGGEFTLRTKQGNERIWDFYATNLGILPGEDQQTAIVMATDVTELREAREKMHLEISKFSQLFIHSPDAIVITDPEGQITDVNLSFEELFGYSFEEVKDRNIDRLLTRDEEGYRESRRNTDRLKEGERYRSETIRYGKDGEAIHVNIGGTAVEIDNDLQSLFHVYTDITEQVQTAEAHDRTRKELQTLFGNLPGMAYRCRNNRNYSMLFVSGGCKNLTGYEPREVMYDNKVAYGKLIHPDDRDHVWNQVQQALQKGKHFELEYRIRTRDNEEKWVWERGTALNLEDDNQPTLQGFISDITERKHQEQKLEELLHQKNTLIKEIHHRVKNNMAVISGLLDLQKSQLVDQRAIDALNRSQFRIYTMANVHEQLYQEKDLTNLQSREYIEKLLDLHREFYASSNISIESRIQSFELNVNQAIPLGLLLNEAITNACQHAFPDNQNGIITASMTLVGEKIEAEVVDNGQGINQEINIETPQTLGFTIMNTLRDQLDAEMDVETSDQGTRIYLTFDREKPRGSASNLNSDFLS